MRPVHAALPRLAALLAAALCAGALAPPAAAQACRDPVVLVHGNAGSPDDFANTRAELRRRGYADAEILRPAWGNRLCPACNDHAGAEEAPVLDALVEASARSCSGRIDVIGHSMGATLAARVIDRHGLAGRVDRFVGIAGAFRGLRSCGTWPFNVPTTTCGANGLALGSPLVASLQGRRFGARMASIKSFSDQIVCATGLCTVGGVHSSSIAGEDANLTYATGHFGLLTGTAGAQADLVR